MLLAASSAQESETNPQGLVPRCRGAMVAGDLAGSFQHEVTCSVCLEYFTDPVTTECGHNFCWACISQCWGEPEPNFSCPQCRETAPQRDLRPNKQLGNLVELVKRLRLQAGPEPEGQRVPFPTDRVWGAGQDRTLGLLRLGRGRDNYPDRNGRVLLPQKYCSNYTYNLSSFLIV
uniref:RING-type domain-containing protein n=1 Tax=Terrapene triunguis TaxID=2587831 RepID=A0A674J712_9SAUR